MAAPSRISSVTRLELIAEFAPRSVSIVRCSPSTTITIVPVENPGSTLRCGVTPWSRSAFRCHSRDSLPTQPTKSTSAPSAPSQAAVLAAEPPGRVRTEAVVSAST